MMTSSPPEPPASARTTSYLVRNGVKVLGTLAFIAALVWWIDWPGVLETVGQMRAWQILGIAALSILQISLTTARWWRVLQHMGERPSWRKLFADQFVSRFFNQFLPGAVSGEFVRAVRAAKRLEVPERAWVSVFYEALLGLLVITMFPMVGILVHPVERHIMIPVVVVFAGALVGLIWAPFMARWGARLSRGRFPRVADVLDRVASAFTGRLAAGAVRAELFVWTVANQFVAFFMLIVAAWHWGEPQIWAAVFIGAPVVSVSTLLPISVGGAGLREFGFVVAMQWFGISGERAVALGLVWLASSLFTGVFGALVLWLERAPEGE